MAESEVRWEDNKIICYLAITLPTSKIRTKRNDNPVAVCQTILKEDDILEWQISYGSKDKEGKIKTLIEAGVMLQLSYKHSIFTRDEIEKIKRFAENVPELFAEKFGIVKEPTLGKFLNEYEIIFRHVPVIHKALENNCFVGAELKHKQRAVGYQPMLYIFIPIKNVISPVGSLIGREAKSKEIVEWSPTKNDIESLIKTFAVLSKSHNRDIIEIVNTIVKEEIS